jgi:hypothetical protein
MVAGMQNNGRVVTITREVIAGLDPALHHPKNMFEDDGYAGPGHAKASPGAPVLGRRRVSEAGKPAYDKKTGGLPRHDAA